MLNEEPWRGDVCLSGDVTDQGSICLFPMSIKKVCETNPSAETGAAVLQLVATAQSVLLHLRLALPVQGRCWKPVLTNPNCWDYFWSRVVLGCIRVFQPRFATSNSVAPRRASARPRQRRSGKQPLPPGRRPHCSRASARRHVALGTSSSSPSCSHLGAFKPGFSRCLSVPRQLSRRLRAGDVVKPSGL